ncbi:MAG: PIN domain-containing protein [Thiohalocapsa sp.]|nr:PIN domain-containing protein [Thiohalocapsa sp.]MCF7991852.1 PIN domain-containing protein [Thiohalocapsa sp.]
MSAQIWFLDTNILVYLFDADEPEKQARARELLRQGAEIRLSTQVLQEFYVATTRKLAKPLPPEQARRVVEDLGVFPISRVSHHLVLSAIDRSVASQVSFWDGLIIETAIADGARRLVSEDLQDGWEIERMRVWNPFASP